MAGPTGQIIKAINPTWSAEVLPPLCGQRGLPRAVGAAVKQSGLRRSGNRQAGSGKRGSKLPHSRFCAKHSPLVAELPPRHPCQL